MAADEAISAAGALPGGRRSCQAFLVISEKMNLAYLLIVFVCNAFYHRPQRVLCLIVFGRSPLGNKNVFAIAGRRRSCNRRRKHERNVLPDCVRVLFSLVFMLNLGNGRKRPLGS